MKILMKKKNLADVFEMFKFRVEDCVYKDIYKVCDIVGNRIVITEEDLEMWWFELKRIIDFYEIYSSEQVVMEVC